MCDVLLSWWQHVKATWQERERTAAMDLRDDAVIARDAAIEASVLIQEERDAFLQGKAAAVRARDAAFEERDSSRKLLAASEETVQGRN